MLRLKAKNLKFYKEENGVRYFLCTGDVWMIAFKNQQLYDYFPNHQHIGAREFFYRGYVQVVYVSSFA